jgi:hypothetical protein
LCCDIIEHSKTAESAKDALLLVMSRFKQWSRLLESQKSGLLDEHKRKGLIGELLFLSSRIDEGTSSLVAVQGWVGANGADQDFVYADGWHEVKSAGVSAVKITISSLEQLDNPDDGELVIKRIDKAAPEKTGAFSLNDVVRQISEKLAADARDLFHSKLSAYGYIDLQEYSEQKYYCSSTQCYRIEETFPKLTKKNVPAQVVSLHYELDLPSLASWKKG